MSTLGHRSRRRILADLCATAVMLWSRPQRPGASSGGAGCPEPPAGTLVRTVPLYGPGATSTPLGRMVGGAGLDARLFTDLSSLAPGRMTIPTDEVFVRTAAPPAVRPTPAAWSIALGAGPGGRTVSLDTLRRGTRDMGEHLIECAGNSNPDNFGLMSAARWHGFPLREVVAAAPRPAGATAVLVSGVAEPPSVTGRSLPGASWVFPATVLDTPAAPFLATDMNGAPLTMDHGAPVRLVVPGWYGCAWIKWVDSIRWVGDDEPATAQMLEFAARTHQQGQPRLARDYAFPTIDTAAMPIRVEQRIVDGRVEYDVVGLVWGGDRPVDQLIIRFDSRDPGVPVTVCPAPRSTATWALWTHRWRPTEPGYYDISLRAADRSIRTRRLDLSFYIRRVRIDEV